MNAFIAAQFGFSEQIKSVVDLCKQYSMQSKPIDSILKYQSYKANKIELLFMKIKQGQVTLKRCEIKVLEKRTLILCKYYGYFY